MEALDIKRDMEELAKKHPDYFFFVCPKKLTMKEALTRK